MVGRSGILGWLLLQVFILLQGSVGFTQSFLVVVTATTSSTNSANHPISQQGMRRNNDDNAITTVESRCACGRVSVRTNLPTPPLPITKSSKKKKQTVTEEDLQAVLQNSTMAQAARVVECHCPACRKFHVAAFGSYLQVPARQVELVEHNGDDEQEATVTALSDHQSSSCWKIYSEACAQVGPVERVMCRHCYSKMLTRPIQNVNNNNNLPASSSTEPSNNDDNNEQQVLVNMGSLVEFTLPQLYRNVWRLPGPHRRQWQSRAVWTDARHQSSKNPQQGMLSQGQCACGKCRYQFPHAPPELQHCYCQLCRQLSGSAFQTWIPVANEHWQWYILQDDDNQAAGGSDESSATTSPLQLIRTTDHGQRHVCTNCGGVLTIVYDEDPDSVWPAAGGLNDDCLPSTTEEFNQHVFRVCHIGCIWKQSWYGIPKDGLERIQYAS